MRVVAFLAFLFLPLSVSASTLKIMTYNAWGVAFAGKNANQRIPQIARSLADSDADIIALQETFEGCFVKNQPKMILKGSRYPYFAKGPRQRGFRCASSGLMVLSRHPILDSDEIVFSACEGIDCVARKGVLYVRIRLQDGREIDVYNTHTDAGLESSVTRQRQMRELIEFVDRNSGDGERAVFVTGDLNATSDSEEMLSLQSELGLRDTYSEFTADRDVSDIVRNGFTADPVRNRNHDGRSEEVGRRIDYILMRDARAAYLPSTVYGARLVFEEPVFREKALSDHFGVRSEIELPM